MSLPRPLHTPAERAGLETELQRLHAAGDMRVTATAAIEGYGAEVLGFLVNLLGDRQDGSDVFASFCEDVWSGLPGFRWQSSMRTWLYTLARNSAFRFRQDPHRRRRVPISDRPEIEEIAERVRTATLPHLRTDAKDEVRRLRDGLDDDDQTLLVLRIDRDMAWNEIAQVMLGTDSSPNSQADAPTLTRKAAALRKRFERVKELLRVQLRKSSGPRS